MDKKDIYQKAERALNQAFETTKHAVKVVSEKAGEAAHITQLLIEKAALEHRVSKQFSKLGSYAYEKAFHEGKTISLKDSEFKALVEEAQKLDRELAQVEAVLERERQTKKPLKDSKVEKLKTSRVPHAN